MGIRLPKIKVGKFLKKVAGAAPKIIGKVAHAVPIASEIVSTGSDIVGSFKKRQKQGQGTAEAALNTVGAYAPEHQVNNGLLIVAAIFILFLVIKR